MSIGKRTQDALYFHRSALTEMPVAIQELVALAAKIIADNDGFSWTVIKVTHNHHRVSFLNYPRFGEEPFPALATASTVDLRSSSFVMRKYGKNGNPPILHRKELLLSPSAPSYARYARLSADLESQGLSSSGQGLGFQRQWNALLAAANLTVVDHRVVREV
jgi:DNA phosphorothioation-associated putative methyltransferase